VITPSSAMIDSIDQDVIIFSHAILCSRLYVRNSHQSIAIGRIRTFSPRWLGLAASARG